METEVPAVSEAVEGFVERALEAVLEPWVLLQVGVIVVGLLLSWQLSRRAVPGIERWARTIKGNPDLLRLIIAFMRRLHWLFFIVWLWVARLIVTLAAWPEQGQLLSLALTLASAWFVISVLTRIIRNRTLARVVGIAIWGYVALVVVGLDEAVVFGLDRAAVRVGTTRITLLLVLQVVVLTAAFVWLAAFIGNVLGHWLERSQDLSPAFKVLIAKVVKTVLIVLAAVLALTATGIDLTALAVFSGGLGVGIGFGLQRVVSNFISGFFILLDKSIKPGDTISLGDTFGWVRDLRARFVSVIARDGREYLIPNEDFITERVVNWSFSSDYVRLDVDFGTAYSSDPHEVVRIAVETAKTIERVSGHVAPVCWLTAFGASSLDFKLRFWISDPRNGVTNVRGQVLLALWDAFKEAGISIPFPHREIFMRTPVEIRGGSDGGGREPAGG